MGAQQRSAARQTGKPEPEVPGPPEGGEWIWELWREIGEGRGTSGFGEQPLSWPDITAWSAIVGVIPSPTEARLVLLLDRSYLAALHEAREKLKPKK